MATAAEHVMASGAARPDAASARKDAPAAAGETSFAEVLGAEVQTTTNAETASDANAAATPAIAPPQAQPAQPLTATSAVELLISLQSADAPVAQQGISNTEGTPVPPKAAPVVAPTVTPEIIAAGPAPAEAAPTPATALQADTTIALPQAPAESMAAPQATATNVAAPAVVATAPKAVQAGVVDTQDEPAAETDSETSAAETSPDVKATAFGADPAPALIPAENSVAAAAPATTAPAQAAIAAAVVPTPKPTVSNTPETAEETSPKAPVAGRESPAAETQAVSPKTAVDPTATSASQTPSNAVKPQTGVQAVAANAAPDVKADAPAPASSNTSTSFADLLAATRGAPADAGKPGPMHPALQSAPQAVAQVYTRFVERFDGRAQRFEVSLTPAELGRVDVRIEIGADKKVHAVLAAHDSAALTDLMRGQRALERALADAGIDLKDGGVKFELANDSGRGLAGQEQRRDARSGEDANVWRGFSTVDVEVEADAPIATASYRRASRLDLVA